MTASEAAGSHFPLSGRQWGTVRGTVFAVRVALLTTELVTNAAKHAGSGRIVIRLAMSEATPPLVTLTVRDEGPGLADSFDVEGAQTLGVKIIRPLLEQMGASLVAKSAHPGAEIAVDIPRTNL